MNRNKYIEISEISSMLANENDVKKIKSIFIEMLTTSEIDTLSKRWRILKMLTEGRTQRDIAKELKVSLCKVTRGSQILKDKKSIIAQYLTKEKNNEYTEI